MSTMARLLTSRARKMILDNITPTPQEIRHQRKVIEKITTHLAELGRKQGRRFSSIEPQGSTGEKQTQIRGAADIDLFVALRPEDYEEIVSLPRPERDRLISREFDGLVNEWFAPAARAAGATKMVKAYSQHPYLSAVIDGIDVDIIFCFDLPAETLLHTGPLTAVDRTVHHTRYVVSHLTDELREDVRILKSFVRASHAYGDSCAVGQIGLTGYAIEVLVILGDGLDGAASLLGGLGRRPVDPFRRNPQELVKQVPSIEEDFAVIIDPVDPNRNVGASFSPRAIRWVQQRLAHLQELTAHRRDNAAVAIVIEKPIPDDPLPTWLAPHCRTIRFIGDPEKHYTLYRDKIYRLMRGLSAALAREGTGEVRFGDVLWEVYFEGYTFAASLIVERPKIEPVYKRRGPPLDLGDAVRAFKKRHSRTYEKDGYVWVDVTRRWTDVDEFIEYYLERHPISGLSRRRRRDTVMARAENVLYRYVMRVEDWFPLAQRQEYKDVLQSLEW